MERITNRSLLYADSNILIYHIERMAPFARTLTGFFEELAMRGARVTTNELTKAECLYKPASVGLTAMISRYEALFDGHSLTNTIPFDLIPLDGGLAARSALIGGTLSLWLTDAIHYLSALEAGCDFFVTADTKFPPDPLMDVILISPNGVEFRAVR